MENPDQTTTENTEAQNGGGPAEQAQSEQNPAPEPAPAVPEIDPLPINLWGAYSAAANGVTYDGRPLPNWDNLGPDRQACWQAVADAARGILTPST